MIVPFKINDEFDTSLIEMDPDMQFYLEINYIKIQNAIITLKTHPLKIFLTCRNMRGHYQCFI